MKILLYIPTGELVYWWSANVEKYNNSTAMYFIGKPHHRYITSYILSNKDIDVLFGFILNEQPISNFYFYSLSDINHYNNPKIEEFEIMEISDEKIQNLLYSRK